jgi:hypothetical protein
MVDRLQPDTNPLHGDKYDQFSISGKKRKTYQDFEKPEDKNNPRNRLNNISFLVAGALLYMWLTL